MLSSAKVRTTILKILLLPYLMLGYVYTLQGAAYNSLTEAMKAGDKGFIQSIINKSQSADRFKWDAFDKQAKNASLYGLNPLQKAARALGNPHYQEASCYLNGVFTLLSIIQEKYPQRIEAYVNMTTLDGHATTLALLAGYFKKKESIEEKREPVEPEVIQDPMDNEPLPESALKLAVKLITQYKANIHISDEDGLTPLHWAARKGYNNLVQLLLKHGASVIVVDNFGKTPLHWAATNGNTDVIASILEYAHRSLNQEGLRALVNQKDKRGRTPLLWTQRQREGAIYYGAGSHMPASRALENIRLLLTYGADPAVQDNEGHDSFYWANHTKKGPYQKEFNLLTTAQSAPMGGFHEEQQSNILQDKTKSMLSNFEKIHQEMITNTIHNVNKVFPPKTAVDADIRRVVEQYANQAAEAKKRIDGIIAYLQQDQGTTDKLQELIDRYTYAKDALDILVLFGNMRQDVQRLVNEINKKYTGSKIDPHAASKIKNNLQRAKAIKAYITQLPETVMASDLRNLRQLIEEYATIQDYFNVVAHQ